MKARPAGPVPRTALTLDEAAASLGVSLSHFRRHVAPGLRIIRTGSARLVPIAELQRWADRSATLAHGDSLGASTKRPRAAQTAGGMAQGEVAP